MKKTIWIAALAAFACSMALPGQVITVTSPTATDDWCIGTSYSITWTRSGAMPDIVSVRLRRAGSTDRESPALTISPRTDNDGLLSWSIPATVAPGEYFIRVWTVQAEGEGVHGDSANFTIMDCSTAPPEEPEPEPPAGASIEVTQPNGSSSWQPGSNHMITWTKSGTMSGMVAITLRREGAPEAEGPVLRIVDGCANNGSRMWFIPDSLAVGRYVVRVRASDGVMDDSAAFAIVSGPAEYDLELKNISYTFGHGGQIVTRVANHRSAIDQDVNFLLVFPEMTRDGAQVVTRRLTLAADSEDNVYLYALPQNNIPLRGLQVRATIDSTPSRISETNEGNNSQETRIAILDISCSAPRSDLQLSKLYLQGGDDFRVRFKIRVRHNLARSVNNIHVHWTLSGPDGAMRDYNHIIESLGSGEEHVWSVDEKYGKEGRRGARRPTLREGTTYRVVAGITDPGDDFYDVNPRNDTSGFTFSFPD